MLHPPPRSARTTIFLTHKKRGWVQSPIKLLLGPRRRGLRFGETNTLKSISQWKCVTAMFVYSAKHVDFSWDPTISIITGAASIYHSATVDSLCLSLGLKKASAVESFFNHFFLPSSFSHKSFLFCAPLLNLFDVLTNWPQGSNAIGFPLSVKWIFWEVVKKWKKSTPHQSAETQMDTKRWTENPTEILWFIGSYCPRSL